MSAATPRHGSFREPSSAGDSDLDVCLFHGLPMGVPLP